MALTKPAGTWTYEDLFALPDDGKRYEIIEGELFEMPPPNLAHATVIANLIALLVPLINALGGRWYTAPVGVFISGANPVEPDIVALLPGSAARREHRGIDGPPDLVIEVLSPSNVSHDVVTKRALYSRAGVREYWIVNPERRTLEVLMLDHNVLRTIQRASEGAHFTSPLLSTAFPLGAVFADIDELESQA
jgi:Uma2 family endonuclease